MRLISRPLALLVAASFAAPIDAAPVEESVLVAPPLIASEVGNLPPDVATEPIEELLPPPSADEPADSPGAERTGDSVAAAELAEALRTVHPWTRFEPGAWRRTRTLSDAFDADGAFVGRSLTERTERLVETQGFRYTLRVDSVIDLAGRRTAGPSESVERSLFSDRSIGADPVGLRALEPMAVTVAGRAVPCRVWEVRWSTATGDELQTLYLAEQSPARVLRRETRAPAEGELLLSEDSVVTLLDAPVRVNEELIPGWYVETTSSRAGGSVSREHSVRSIAAPGGIHQRVVVEYDGLGHRSRWAVTELVAWGMTADETITPESLSADDQEPSALEPGVRPRRLLRLLRRAERAEKSAPPESVP